MALSGGDLLYFELDDVGQLVEVGKKELGNEVVCLDIAPIPEGRQRARFLGMVGGGLKDGSGKGRQES